MRDGGRVDSAHGAGPGLRGGRRPRTGEVRLPDTLENFAHGLRASLARHLSPAMVSFRGSLAGDTHDEYNDVGLRADVHQTSDERFFSGLGRFLIGLYGPALVRYDPDFRHPNMAQDVRFSFYRLPVFWRVDLQILSDEATDEM